MQITNIYRKLLYKNKLAPINIGYTSSKSWYDNCLKNFTDPAINFVTFPNTIAKEHLIFINDPLIFTTQHIEKKYHLGCVLFFHDQSLLSLKKEDMYLLNEKITQYKRYTFSPLISNVISNTELISYGFKKINNESQLMNRSKSIVIIGEHRNIDQIIFKEIKQLYTDTDFLVVNPNNIQIDINQLLSQYKVCINMSSSYNTLLGAANGCITLSQQQEQHIPHHYVVNNIKDIDNALKHTFGLYNPSQHLSNYHSIISNYDYDTFHTKIKNIIDTTINMANIYE